MSHRHPGRSGAAGGASDRRPDDSAV